MTAEELYSLSLCEATRARKLFRIQNDMYLDLTHHLWLHGWPLVDKPGGYIRVCLRHAASRWFFRDHECLPTGWRAKRKRHVERLEEVWQ